MVYCLFRYAFAPERMEAEIFFILSVPSSKLICHDHSKGKREERTDEDRNYKIQFHLFYVSFLIPHFDEKE